MSLPPTSGKNAEEQRRIDAAWDKLHAEVLPVTRSCRECNTLQQITKGEQLKQTTGYGSDSLWTRCPKCDRLQLVYGRRELQRLGIEDVMKGLSYL